MTAREEPLLGGNVTAGLVRVGDTVRRPAGPWTPAVHAVPRRLEDVEFRHAPRSFGLDEQGRHVLEHVPGPMAHPDAAALGLHRPAPTDIGRLARTKASTWNDRPRAQRVAGELEVEHGLVVLESRTVGRGSRGAKPAEQARQVRTGAPETERVTLARRVRAIATAARDEGEFVRRSRREGLLIRPRYAAGRDDVVAGYSVALRAPAGERAVWFGGGHLGRDLTLPRLREQWPDTPQGAGDAVAEWNAARRGTRPVAPGREIDEPDPQMWEAYASEIGALREQLRAVPADDAGTWAQKPSPPRSPTSNSAPARCRRSPPTSGCPTDPTRRRRAEGWGCRRGPGVQQLGLPVMLAGEVVRVMRWVRLWVAAVVGARRADRQGPGSYPAWDLRIPTASATYRPQG